MAAVAGGCVIAHLFALAHLVVVEHERCAEHGEMVHANQSAAGIPFADVTPPSAPADAALPAYIGDGAGDHDHCLTVTERRDRHGDRVQAVVFLPLEPRASLPDAAAPPLARALYRSAPKTSPPHLA